MCAGGKKGIERTSKEMNNWLKIREMESETSGSWKTLIVRRAAPSLECECKGKFVWEIGIRKVNFVVIRSHRLAVWWDGFIL